MVELNCAPGGVLGPVSLSDRDDGLEMPAREGRFPVGTVMTMVSRCLQERGGFPVGTVSDNALEMPAREECFPVGSDSLV